MSEIDFLKQYPYSITQAVWIYAWIAAGLIVVFGFFLSKSWRGKFIGCTIALVILGFGVYLRQLNAISPLKLSVVDTDVSVIYEDLLREIPSGMLLAEAQKRMTDSGYQCTIYDPSSQPVRAHMGPPQSIQMVCTRKERWWYVAHRHWFVRFLFPPAKSTNPPVNGMHLFCAHTFWRVFLFGSRPQDANIAQQRWLKALKQSDRTRTVPKGESR